MSEAFNSNELNKMINSSEIKVNMDDICQMNVIINDNDCGDTLIKNVCRELENMGLSFRLAKNANEINYDNSVVISLDQQYNSGSDTIIFAPYNNTRLGNSDSLALSMRGALEKNKISIRDVLCGQVGYFTDDDGNVMTTKPTSTENAIDDNNDASFVTIAFGTENIDAENISKSIIEGLARFKYYLDNYDNNNDLIYRANINNSLDDVANYFGSDVSKFKEYNKINDGSFSESQTVINPSVSDIVSFDKEAEVEIINSRIKSY